MSYRAALLFFASIIATGFVFAEPGFRDTVVLTNGKVIEKVRATEVGDSVVVTEADGSTVVYRQTDVQDVRKSSGSTTYDPKASGNWSADQGYMTWEAAVEKCQALKMRLPSISELKKAHGAGITKSWMKEESNYYWSSTPDGDTNAIYLNIQTGEVDNFLRSVNLYVRCIR